MEHLKHLKKDKTLAKAMLRQPVMELKKKKNVHLHLVASIMSQQLSVKVADVIYNRFLGLYGGKVPSPQQVLDTPFEKLRGIGLSGSKTSYIHNVSRFAIEQGLDFRKLEKMEDGKIKDYLVSVKGVGKWTAEMQLMFTLGREDIFPVDDLGIQQAMQKLYGIKAKDKKALYTKMEKIAAQWKPYRTYACMYLWRWKDSV
ncbi:MAG: DNA-3-methyladenine glycosylase family protein [Bacteroidota bacterium]